MYRLYKVNQVSRLLFLVGHLFALFFYSVLLVYFYFGFFCSYLHSSHEIVLRRSHPGSWGFSIVGGYEESHSNQAFFIKTIVLGTPAYYDGRLK